MKKKGVYYMALVDTYSKNELEQIISNSNNFSEVCKKLGYKSDSTKTREVIILIYQYLILNKQKK